MLVQFTVENFLSFAGESTLSMLASGDPRHPEHLLHEGEEKGGPLLRTAAIYGANAAGKSNLFHAITFARELIVEGTRPDRGIPTRPFRLDPTRGGDQPSRFQFIFRAGGQQFDYGFVVERARVCEEWLFGTGLRSGAKESLWFERKTDAQGNTTVNAGNVLSGRSARRRQRIDFLAEGTRPNQLFLTEARERNFGELEMVWNWFRQLVLLTPESSQSSLVPVIHQSDGLRPFMSSFLRLAGTGIQDISLREEPFDPGWHLGGASASVREELEARVRDLGPGDWLVANPQPGERLYVRGSERGEPVVLDLEFLHSSTGPVREYFGIDEESDGTRRMIDLLPAISLLRSQPRVVFVDELDRRLHPHLTRLFVEAALDRSNNPGSQLLFTTHDTNLLDADLLRRDEIWFVEKDPSGASHLYSLAEFRVRPDLQLEKGYLNGRFGAIPFIGDLKSLGWEAEPTSTEALTVAG